MDHQHVFMETLTISAIFSSYLDNTRGYICHEPHLIQPAISGPTGPPPGDFGASHHIPPARQAGKIPGLGHELAEAFAVLLRTGEVQG